MIYDQMITQSDYTFVYSHLAKQQYSLNYLSVYDDDVDKIKLDKVTPTNN